MKKVLFLDHASVIGGSQLVLVNYLKYLNRNKFEVYVACSKDQPPLIKMFKEHAKKIYLVEFAQLKLANPLVVFRYVADLISIYKIIKLEKIEIVCTNTERAMYVGSVAAFLTNTKLVWFIRDFRYNKMLLKILLVLRPKIFCVSKSIQSFYDLEDCSEVIYVASDMDKRIAKVSARKLAAFKKKYGLENKTVIGFVGALAKWKGYQVLVRAFSALNRKNTVCLIVGKADETLENKEFNTSFIKEAKKIKNVVFTGFSSEPELAFLAMDIYVHASILPEPFATSVIEAMLCRVPVIATNIGGTPEIVKPGKTGLLVKPDDEHALIKAIRELMASKTLRSKLTKNAYTSVMSKCSLTAELKKLEEAFGLL